MILQSRSSTLLLGGLMLVFFVIRVFHLLFYFPEPFTEELLRGTIAKELIEGLKMPFFEYAADHYSGGSLIYGVLTVPWFLLLGKSVFALRLTAFLFQLLTMITWYLLMRRFFNQKVALYTALLYIFSPPWLTLSSTYAMGVHTETLFFTAVGLFFLFQILFEKNTSLIGAAGLGLTLGFGTYFSYQCAVSSIIFLFFWGYVDPRFFQRKAFYQAVLFFVIGFSPWGFYNFQHTFQGFDRVREGFAYPGWERILIIPFRFLKLATYKVIGMLSFNYRGGVGWHPYFPGHPVNPHTTLLNLFYYGTVGYAYWELWKRRGIHKKTHLLFIFPFGFLLIAALSRFDISTYGSRYLVPIFPFFFASLALMVEHVEQHHRLHRKASLSILGFLLAMGMMGQFNLLSAQEVGLSLKHRGYSYRQLGGALAFRHPKGFDRLSQLTRHLEPQLSQEENFQYHLGLKNRTSFHLFSNEDFIEPLRWLRTLHPTHRPFYLYEIGFAWGGMPGPFFAKVEEVKYFPKEEQPHLLLGLIDSLQISRMKPEPLLRQTLIEIKSASPENQKALLYGVGKVPLFHFNEENNFLYKVLGSHQVEQTLSPTLISAYYYGMGAFLMHLYDPVADQWSPYFIRNVDVMNEQYKEALFWGAGFEAPIYFEDPYEIESMKKSLPFQWQAVFEKGVRDRFHYGGRYPWLETRIISRKSDDQV